MRKALVLVSSLILSIPFYGQWSTSGTQIYNSNSGNVGIGTSSPGSLLHVNGVFQWGGGSSNVAYSGQDPTGLWFEQAGSTSAKSGIRFQSSKSADFTNYSQFIIDPYNGFSFLSLNGGSGRVGIGLSSPSSILHIKGPSPFLTIQNTSFTDGGISFINDLGAGIWKISHDNTAGNLYFRDIQRATTALTIEYGTGKIGIGTTSPTERLSVNGNVYASGNIMAYGYVKTKKLTVTQTAWPDYVFERNYKLRDLTSLENYIRQNKHLPEMPTAREAEENGISVGDNQALLLKKIEELTLYVIELNKRASAQKLINQKLMQQIKQVKNQINKR